MATVFFLILTAFCGYLVGRRQAQTFYDLGYDHGTQDTLRMLERKN
ncbi:MAG: hypothetical protein ABW128_07090 [Rhizorhabdus sp.]